MVADLSKKVRRFVRLLGFCMKSDPLRVRVQGWPRLLALDPAMVQCARFRETSQTKTVRDREQAIARPWRLTSDRPTINLYRTNLPSLLSLEYLREPSEADGNQTSSSP